MQLFSSIIFFVVSDYRNQCFVKIIRDKKLFLSHCKSIDISYESRFHPSSLLEVSQNARNSNFEDVCNFFGYISGMT